jgi:RsiW-degrading membrane proteinase PrsW (M82 family)
MDGLIYAGTVALGFASAENLYYVATHGSQVLVIRGLLSVPAHFLFAASYGYAMGMKKGVATHEQGGLLTASTKRSQSEKAHIPHPDRGPSLAKGLFIAILAHGAFNFTLFSGDHLESLVVAWGGVAVIMLALTHQWRRYVRTLESLSQFKPRDLGLHAK